LKQHKPWFDEKCLQFLNQRKQGTVQWLHDPNHSNLDNRNNVGCEASRHFRNKKNKYLKAKIDELEINSLIKNIEASVTLTLCRRVVNLIKYPPVPGRFKFFECSTPKCTVTYILTLLISKLHLPTNALTKQRMRKRRKSRPGIEPCNRKNDFSRRPTA
jgi:hypothetical protein